MIARGEPGNRGRMSRKQGRDKGDDKGVVESGEGREQFPATRLGPVSAGWYGIRSEA